MRILAFGIHPDDVELGCGGTVILAVQQGHEVSIVDLSEGTSSSNGTPAERSEESAEAARIMGVSDRANLGLPDTRIRSESADQIAAVVASLRKTRPDVVLTPWWEDAHPDHSSGGRLIQRALYLSGVHGYRRGEPAWQTSRVLVYPGRIDFDPHVVVDVSSTHEIKVRAFLAHASQFRAGEGRVPTPLNAPDFIDLVEARSRLHGRRIGVRFGEPFRTLGPIGLADFRVFEG